MLYQNYWCFSVIFRSGTQILWIYPQMFKYAFLSVSQDNKCEIFVLSE